MKKPKISIIIPVYNDEKYLEECLNSVINQSFNDFECICVDDCSIDKSAEIIESFIQKDKRIKYIKHETNQGVSNSRYTGLLQAKADWIAFVDHDDVISPKYLEFLYEEVDDENDVDAVCCKNEDLSNNLCFDENKIKGKRTYNCKDEIVNRKYAENSNILCIWAKIIKKEILLNLGVREYKNIYPKTWFEDLYVMSYYYIECKNITVIDNVLYGYRVNMESLSHTIIDEEYYVNRVECDLMLIDKYLQQKMYEKAFELYEGNLLAYMKAIYFLKEKAKNIEKCSYMINNFNKAYDKNKSLHKRMNIYTRINTRFFRSLPTLWEKTVGFLYFDVASKFPGLYKKLGSLR